MAGAAAAVVLAVAGHQKEPEPPLVSAAEVALKTEIVEPDAWSVVMTLLAAAGLAAEGAAAAAAAGAVGGSGAAGGGVVEEPHAVGLLWALATASAKPVLNGKLLAKRLHLKPFALNKAAQIQAEACS